jgi:predicted nucleic acid-binding Zn ribbon protein
MRRWDEIVGVGLASRSCPDRYTKGTVWVAVQGSAWAQELRMMKEIILGRLREISGEPSLFVDVRFGVRPLPDTREESTVVEVVAPDPEPAPEAGLSIRDIAKRRLEKWKGENGA